MELMQFGDLGDYLDFPWEDDDVKILAVQLLAGVGFLHANKITHRDLKPGVCSPNRVSAYSSIFVCFALTCFSGRTSSYP